jgi:hypothetical protein
MPPGIVPPAIAEQDFRIGGLSSRLLKYSKILPKSSLRAKRAYSAEVALALRTEGTSGSRVGYEGGIHPDSQ